jgi:hypothetical protein
MTHSRHTRGTDTAHLRRYARSGEEAGYALEVRKGQGKSR